MSQRQMTGNCYYQHKNGILYEIFLPSKIERRPKGRSIDVCKYDVKRFGDNKYLPYNVQLPSDPPEEFQGAPLEIIAARALFSLLGEDKNVIRVGDLRQRPLRLYPDRKDNEKDRVHAEVLKYALARFDIEKARFRVIEFMGAIPLNADMIYERLIQLNNIGWISFSEKKPTYPLNISMEYLYDTMSLDITDSVSIEEKIKELDQKMTMLPSEQAEMGEIIELSPIPPLPRPDRPMTRNLSFSIAPDNAALEDILGYRTYADAIARIIKDNRSAPPLTIGICGSWGRGKTTLLNYIEDAINSAAQNAPRLSYQCVKFSPWKYLEAKQMWADFYVAIVDKIVGKLKILEQCSIRWHLYKATHDLRRRLLLFAATLFALALILAVGYSLYNLTITDVAKIGISMLLSGSFIAIFISVIEISAPFISQIISKRRRFKFSSILGIQYDIFNHIDAVSDWLEARPERRIVVFIDDIDRCHPDQIIQVFESIKLLFERGNFVFIVSMDARIVGSAIGAHYKFMGEMRPQWDNMGSLYLDKLIQIPFHLPRPSADKLNQLLRNTLHTCLEKSSVNAVSTESDTGGRRQKTINAKQKTQERSQKNRGTGPYPAPASSTSDSAEKAKLTTEEMRDIEKIFATPGFNPSPRLAKRFVNIYLIARHIYILEKGGVEANAPDDSFIKWLALSLQYPHESASFMKIMEMETPDNIAEFVTRSGSGGGTGEEASLNHSSFKCLDRERLLKFLDIYRRMNIDFEVIRKTRHIIECFNPLVD